MELPTSAAGDAVLCGITADVDLDGSVEILLGTFGRQLLVYKWESSAWDLRATRTLPHPVHGLHHLDVTGDGVRELLILTPKGLHVFQVWKLREDVDFAPSLVFFSSISCYCLLI